MLENIKQKILEYKIQSVTILIVLLLSGAFWLMNNNKQPQTTSVFKHPTSETSKQVQSSKTSETKGTAGIYVDVQGEINRPGFYRLKRDARVFDLLQLAGGLKETADHKQVNQAQKLTDQEQVYIPKKGENVNNDNLIETQNNDGEKGEKADVPATININTASVDELQNLTGVGPKKAEQIVQFREENGDFGKVEDLTKVSGIGEKTLETLKDQITV